MTSNNEPLRQRTEADEASLFCIPDSGVKKIYRDKGIVLAYYDACLWRKDMSSVLYGRWMTDNFVVFWLEYLSHADEFSSRSEIIFLHPGAQFMLLSESMDDVFDATKDLELSSRQMIFLPLTSDDNPGGPPRLKTDKGGPHRSLFVWVKRDDCFYHFDSSPGKINANKAEYIARVMWGVLLRGANRDKGTPFPGVKSPNFPRQVLPTDCGHIMLLILHYLVMVGTIVPLENLITPSAVFKFREYTKVTAINKLEEYMQLKGQTRKGKIPRPEFIVTGAEKMAKPTTAEDLESVIGDLEDMDEEALKEEEEWNRVMMERTRDGEGEEVFELALGGGGQ